IAPMISTFKLGGGLLLIAITLGGCVRERARLATTPASPAPALPVDRLQFQEGIKALYEFTPEGYARALERFNRASALAPDNCEYRLHAAQAHLFLALEQKLNRENFRDSWDNGADPGCAPGSAFSLRLEVFRGFDDFGVTRDRTALAKINQAIELDP